MPAPSDVEGRELADQRTTRPGQDRQERLRRLTDLGLRLLFPVILAVYLSAFWLSVEEGSLIMAGYPRVLIGVVAGLLLLAIIIELRDAHRGVRPLIRKVGRAALPENWWRAPATGLAVVAFYVSASIIGFFVSAFIFVGSIMFLLGIRQPVLIISATTGFVVSSYYLFIELFDLRLPQGLLL